MNNKNKKSLTDLVYGSAIAAIYVSLTYVFAPISFGPIQLRISEALCILPVFTPAAIPGLFVGCLLGNLLGSAVPMDVIFGSLATLIGAMGTFHFRNSKILSIVPPILANAIIVPWVLRYAYGAQDMIPLMMLTVGIGEILAVGVIGNLLRTTLERYKVIIFGSSLKG